MFNAINESVNEFDTEKLEERLAEELEERVEFGCWATNCSSCNDRS